MPFTQEGSREGVDERLLGVVLGALRAIARWLLAVSLDVLDAVERFQRGP